MRRRDKQVVGGKLMVGMTATGRSIKSRGRSFPSIRGCQSQEQEIDASRGGRGRGVGSVRRERERARGQGEGKALAQRRTAASSPGRRTA